VTVSLGLRFVKTKISRCCFG